MPEELRVEPQFIVNAHTFVTSEVRTTKGALTHSEHSLCFLSFTSSFQYLGVSTLEGQGDEEKEEKNEKPN